MALFSLQTADNEINPRLNGEKFPVVMERGAPMKRFVLFLLSIILLGGVTDALADRRPPPRPSGGRGHRPPPRRPPLRRPMPLPPRHHHTSHTSFGFVFGGPLWSYPAYSPYYSYYPYGPYYPYPSQTIVIQSSPTRYIEKNENNDAGQYWYYCKNPKGYYPYVQKCNVNWQKVIPFPLEAQ